MDGVPTDDELRTRLASHDCTVVTEAAEALAQRGVRCDEATLAPLRATLQTHGIGNCARLARAYLALVDPQRAAATGAWLVEQTPNLAAVGALGPATLPFLAPLLDDPDDTTRWRACWAIRHVAADGDGAAAAAVPLLVHAIEDDSFPVCLAAAHGLVDAGPRALEPLLQALTTRPATLTFHHAARRVLARARVPGAEAEAARAALVDSLGHDTTLVQSGWLALRLLRHLRAYRSPEGDASSWQRTWSWPTRPLPATR